MRFDEFENRAVVITGGANGIGEALVRSFHGHGARVFFSDKDQGAGTRLTEELGERAEFLRVDLTSESEILSWTAAVRRAVPDVRALINNAAWDPRMDFGKTTTAQWDELFALNVRAYFLMARECSAAMTAGAAIVNVSSVTFHTAPRRMVAYVSTKGAVHGFTRSLARELGERRIRVNTLSPGWVWTERQKRDYLDAEAQRLIREHQCVPDHIQPEEIARVALFMCSDLSAAVTGQEILADRGWAHS
jgi:D-xylose 1-dehydrogenase